MGFVDVLVLLAIVLSPGVLGFSQLVQEVVETENDTRFVSSELKMESVAHIAASVVQEMCCKLDPERVCDSGEKPRNNLLKEWGSRDSGWERMVSALSLYEVATRLWQGEERNSALLAADQSMALKLFPYQELSPATAWQQGLVSPSSTMKYIKLELADILILKAKLLFEIGQREKDVSYLHQALEAVHLASALIYTGWEPTLDILYYLERLAIQISRAAAEALAKLQIGKLKKAMELFDIECQACLEKRELLYQIIQRLELPLKLTGSGTRIDVLESEAFVPHAYTKHDSETTLQFQQRLFLQLLNLVEDQTLASLKVPCTISDESSSCVSYAPPWVADFDCTEGQDYVICGALHTSPRYNKRLVREALRLQEQASSHSSTQQDSQRLGATKSAGIEKEQRLTAPAPGMVQETTTFPKVRTSLEAVEGFDVAQSLKELNDYLRSTGQYASTGGSGQPELSQSFRADKGIPILDYANQIQMCLRANRQSPAVHCEQLLRMFKMFSTPTVPPPAMEWSSYVGPLEPLKTSEIPPPPQPGQCCPTFRKRLLTEASEDNCPLNSCKNRPGGCSTSSRTVTAPPEDARQASDRQLQEQLTRIANENTHSRKDDPFIVITISSVTLFSFLSYMVSKHRRRIGRCFGTWVFFRPASPAVSPSAPLAIPESQHKRLAAAALRDAIAAGDIGKLEMALRLAAELDLDGSLVARAQAVLQQRKRKERQQQHVAKLRAKDAARRAEKRTHATTGKGSLEGSGNDPPDEDHIPNCGSCQPQSWWWQILCNFMGPSRCNVQIAQSSDAHDVCEADEMYLNDSSLDPSECSSHGPSSRGGGEDGFSIAALTVTSSVTSTQTGELLTLNSIADSASSINESSCTSPTGASAADDGWQQPASIRKRRKEALKARDNKELIAERPVHSNVHNAANGTSIPSPVIVPSYSHDLTQNLIFSTNSSKANDAVKPVKKDGKEAISHTPRCSEIAPANVLSPRDVNTNTSTNTNTNPVRSTPPPPKEKPKVLVSESDTAAAALAATAALNSVTVRKPLGRPCPPSPDSKLPLCLRTMTPPPPPPRRRQPSTPASPSSSSPSSQLTPADPAVPFMVLPSAVPHSGHSSSSSLYAFQPVGSQLVHSNSAGRAGDMAHQPEGVTRCRSHSEQSFRKRGNSQCDEYSSERRATLGNSGGCGGMETAMNERVRLGALGHLIGCHDSQASHQPYDESISGSAYRSAFGSEFGSGLESSAFTSSTWSASEISTDQNPSPNLTGTPVRSPMNPQPTLFNAVPETQLATGGFLDNSIGGSIHPLSGNWCDSSFGGVGLTSSASPRQTQSSLIFTGNQGYQAPPSVLFGSSMWAPASTDMHGHDLSGWDKCPSNVVDWRFPLGIQSLEGPEDVMGTSPSDNLDTNDWAQSILRTVVE